MKNIILFIVLFCQLSFGQGWNTTVQTTINEPNLEKMDLFTNSSGNHVLIKRTNGDILYYRLNSQGNVTRNLTLANNGDFPNIVGTNDIIIAIYKVGDQITGKYSLTNGLGWTSLPNNVNTTSNLCNGIDAVYELDNGVHLVWATRDDYPNFKTYYSRLTPYPDHSWVEFQNVTSHASAPVGGRPSVTVSPNRVHVSFNTSYFEEPYAYGFARTRDRLNGVWQTPQPVSNDETVKEKLLVRGNTLFAFYAKWNYNGGLITNDLVYRTRSISGSTWSSPTTLAYTIEESGNAFNFTKTSNDNIHAVFYPEWVGQQDGLVRRVYNGSSWSSPVLLDNDPRYGKNFGLSSVSNDLYLCFMRGSDNYLRYKQYDANPLTPSNFAGGIHDIGWNAYPKITWDAVNEPDVRINGTNGIIVERSLNLGAFSVVANLSGQTTSFIDWGVPYAGSGPGSARYRIKSRDINAHESDWTSIVNIAYGDAWKIGADNNIVSVKPENFYLSSNYPNPFNPSTRINYALPEEANVQLKVYDMLGSEVAELVNETKRAGYHIVDFDASNLSSGIYIYRITALRGERILFNESKRMILMK